VKILHISNHSVDRCGVALFGRQCSAALRAEGAEVVDWDGYYPTIYAKERRHEPSYLPPDVSTYDVVHLNWQPGTLNHYHPALFPRFQWPTSVPGWTGPIYSIFLHDLPPWSTCLVEDRMHVKFALEPYEGAVVIPPPAPDYVPSSPVATKITIGRTNIRDAGRSELAEICAHQGWILNDSNPDHWLSEAGEVERLARSWVNVVWYAEHRSRGSAAMVAAAARRPLLLSESERFAHLWPYANEFYVTPVWNLEGRLLAIVTAVSEGVAKVPVEIPIVFGWRRAARRMIAAWEAVLP
jgi:hypothetical protein